jgi:ornithine decarboxylase
MSFQTLLKAAAVADGDGPQTRQRLDHIAVENYQIEVNDRFDRDVSEDAAVGACIAATGGIRREQARQPAPGIRTTRFRTPLWSIVESYQVADADVLGPAGEIEGF